MSNTTKPLEDLVRGLPPALRDEVRDFVEFLLGKDQDTPRGIPAFGWEGALKDMSSRYTSVDLEHLIARWRTEGE
jgi:hypothetical protein